MSNVLAVNAGSSSLKFQLFQMPEEIVLAKGLTERIGLKDSIFTVEIEDNKKKTVQDIPNHEIAVKQVLETLTSSGVIQSLDEIDAVGHRVVHGGERFSDSVPITDQVIQSIEELSELAPLHNPANLTGILAFKEVLPEVPMVAVFDTAFHQTMPESSYLYSLPYEYYKDYGIRKYGFHGTSHKYVSQRAAELLNMPVEQLRLISCHLGNGASIAAIQEGKSIDTSMGFTPLAGVTMGTRSGNIDPALIPYVMEKTGKTAEEVIHVLNKESGMLALSGFSSDLRDIEQQAGDNERAELALEVFAGRIHKYLGSYAAKMSGVDAIIFTAGVGENSDVVREKVLHGLEFMGVYWDPARNKVRGQERFINYPHSPVKVIIIPTNEEVMIARDTVEKVLNK
ncbi:acetate/propionate family kinase [Virgibacillus halodenitrificans]|jgi:acetate kinase|uniref:Acetate kinase n=1 Tax=Virgibacillus halodenitrificans TaxID=1482 RepID=A0AAC9J1L1_VIRHA|nr:acetate kinase [Virgibacillus halodenitrificans]APC48014.1 acetate kinase [Virgibacillus halodenitrificans]MCG1027782.1 acetate kinase [Virgibacillus halodenitrificans]MCJ0931764.1 acetate kinase [Virgibacillus halodenitrificans]MEC2159837.1 acetate kinase [Virgibacillus halodenitrificans]MYL44783.1 acetate/propionate family kinase [Virgibacillus halodenitrificans]